MKWDEPKGAVTPRGWLFRNGLCRGNYLDYGAGHYRSSHDWCAPGRCECRQSQPGDVHAIRYPNGPRAQPYEWHYFETIEAAKTWIEGGQS